MLCVNLLIFFVLSGGSWDLIQPKILITRSLRWQWLESNTGLFEYQASAVTIRPLGLIPTVIGEFLAIHKGQRSNSGYCLPWVCGGSYSQDPGFSFNTACLKSVSTSDWVENPQSAAQPQRRILCDDIITQPDRQHTPHPHTGH